MESSKTLDDLAKAVGGNVVGTHQVAIADVTHDSRQAGTGTLFVAIKGASFDGHDFIGQAIDAGASAICVSAEQFADIPQLVVSDTRGALGELAAEVHGWPSRALDVIGVTGTNGKTTVTHYIESLLSMSGLTTGLIGTIETRIAGERQTSVRTTPEASDFQRLLRRMREHHVEKVAVEVSSHALELSRVAGTRFRVAAFTNLSQDHLDFHQDMDRYRAAKERLFRDYEVDAAVINIDDEVGSSLAGRIGMPLITVGDGGDFGFSSLSHDAHGTEFTFDSPGGSHRVSAPVHGDFNVSNLVIALACCYASGVDLGDVLEHVSLVSPVPGRFEKLADTEGAPMVIVDYAHTPEGIEKAIETARQIAIGNVIALFGAGGDRDRGKRPLMGQAASAADLVVVTSDNPRSEPPEDIIAQVSTGVTAPLIRQVDRARAITEALSVAGPDDVVLILGKGHEQGQEIQTRIVPFDDRSVAAEALIRLGRSRSSGTNSGSMSR